MRIQVSEVGGFRVFAVTGINTISFGIQATPRRRRGPRLCGRTRSEGERARQDAGVQGIRVGHSQSQPNMQVSTLDHPVQSFVWDDFTANPDSDIRVLLPPAAGQTGKNLDRTAAPVPIGSGPSRCSAKDEHDVFFNRGVASSQAYEREFGNQTLDKLAKAQRARGARTGYARPGRGDSAVHRQRGSGDTLLCSFYEFRYQPVAEALKTATTRGVDVRIIIDAKVNEFTDKKGDFHPSFPREDNLKAIAEAGIPRSCIIRRQANPNDIQHNKFMVLLEGATQTHRGVDGIDEHLGRAASPVRPTSATGCANATAARSSRSTGTCSRPIPGSAKRDDPRPRKGRRRRSPGRGGARHRPPTVAEIPDGAPPCSARAQARGAEPLRRPGRTRPTISRASRSPSV